MQRARSLCRGLSRLLELCRSRSEELHGMHGRCGGHRVRVLHHGAIRQRVEGLLSDGFGRCLRLRHSGRSSGDQLELRSPRSMEYESLRRAHRAVGVRIGSDGRGRERGETRPEWRRCSLLSRLSDTFVVRVGDAWARFVRLQERGRGRRLLHRQCAHPTRLQPHLSLDLRLVWVHIRTAALRDSVRRGRRA
jgi:hypothetical protein